MYNETEKAKVIQNFKLKMVEALVYLREIETGSDLHKNRKKAESWTTPSKVVELIWIGALWECTVEKKFGTYQEEKRIVGCFRPTTSCNNKHDHLY